MLDMDHENDPLEKEMRLKHKALPTVPDLGGQLAQPIHVRIWFRIATK